jgi:hypothetical protein
MNRATLIERGLRAQWEALQVGKNELRLADVR